MANRTEYTESKQCSTCNEVKPLSSFWKRGSKRKDGTQTYRHECTECGTASRLEIYYNQGGKERQKERAFKNLLKRYGITPEIYEQERAKQKFRCLLCGAHESTQHHKRLYIDHCHATGKYRGLLCNACNTGLGSFRDNTETLEKAIEYLNAHST